MNPPANFVNHRAAGYEAPICVIIPTHNRADILLKCLEHLEKQSCSDFEVIVIDDGSMDATTETVQRFLARTPLRLRYFHQDNSGAGRARNLAISMTQSPFSLFIGDDIFATPDFVACHLDLHRRHPEPQVAGLGLTEWSTQDQTVTPFMKWLVNCGEQFAYSDLLSGARPDWKYFYTSNLSVKTAVLRQYPFDETLKTALEDIELGYRIETRHGLKLIFLPEALAYHHHPTTFRQACKRKFNAAAYANRFYELWPELLPPQPGKLRRFRNNLLMRSQWLLPLFTWLGDFFTRFWCPNPVMRHVLNCYGILGYHSARFTSKEPSTLD